jgi:hypothetical protein
MLAASLAGLIYVVAAQPAPAANGTFDVVFCNELNLAAGAEFNSTNAFTTRNRCADPSNSSTIKIDNVDRAEEGRSATARWAVGEPLSIVGVDARARLRRANGYKARLFTTNDRGQITYLIAEGTTEAAQFSRERWSGSPQSRFVARLECTNAPSCPQSTLAKTWIRDITFTVRDSADPEVRVGGSLFSAGWIRGSTLMRIDMADDGSGLTRADLIVNNEVLHASTGSCSQVDGIRVSNSFQPCKKTLFHSSAIETTGSSFRNGLNDVSACSEDFAGNRVCLDRLVKVDNSSPDLSFANEQDSNDPERITVAALDPHSGLKTGLIYFRAVGTVDWRPLLTRNEPGALTARVDSASETPGTYEFKVLAEDVAGNEAETTLREDGTPMTLEFPLRSGVDLDGSLRPGGSKRTVVDYNKSVVAKGQLLDAAGRPMPGHEVVVDEYFGEGALIDHRVRTVATDDQGRWESGIPAGPSRSVSVSYAGDQRYLSDEANIGRLAVKSRARFGLSKRKVREGRAVAFLGKVGRRGARIPTRGKLLQLQFYNPVSKRWNTVRNPFRTRSDGRYRFRYRFGNHYATDVSIRFRLKVAAEGDWPYRPIHTRARRVIVKAR